MNQPNYTEICLVNNILVDVGENDTRVQFYWDGPRKSMSLSFATQTDIADFCRTFRVADAHRLWRHTTVQNPDIAILRDTRMYQIMLKDGNTRITLVVNPSMVDVLTLSFTDCR